MGDSERSDDSKSGDQRPTAEVSSNDLRQTGVWSEDEPASRISITPDGDKPQVRRSSIRPAPASFRPSKREPGQLMRPTMVIHAGDVDPVVPLWDNADPTPSHPSQPSIHAHPRVEPFALADDFAPSNPAASAPQAAPNAAPESAPDAAATRAASASIQDQAPELDATARATDSRSGNATVPKPAPLRAMPIRSAAPEPGSRLPLHRNTLSHFGAPNRGSRPEAAAKAAVVVEASSEGNAALPAKDINAPSPHSSNSSDPDAPATGRRRSGAYIAAILSAVILAGVFVAMMVGRSGTVATPAGAPSVAVNPKTEQAADPSAVVHEAPTELVSATPVTAAESAAPSAPAEAPPEVANPSAPPVAASPANAVRVTLDVRPTDSKVIYQGRLQPGPPYEFEVTKGKRMALEVVRFGFVTQKVVLDGRKPVVLVGLRRAPGHSTADRH